MISMGLSINLFGIFIALGSIMGLYVLIKEGKRKEMNIDELYNIVIGAFIFAIIGARIYFVLAFSPQFYLENPLQILFIHQGGLSIQGALLGGIIFTAVYTKYKKMSFWKVADAFAPALIVGQAIGRIGCDVFGVEMSTPRVWGVNVNGLILHPTQIYEALLNFALFLVLWNYRDKIKYNGQIFGLYLLGFSFNRALVELFRTNPIIIGQITIARVTAFVFAIIAIGMLCLIRKDENTINNKKPVSPASKKRDGMIIFILMLVSTLIYYYIYL
ncbi:prolipoprotein diacylglyceryl transferase [Natronospora cellulosivora (SeqCode)]